MASKRIATTTSSSTNEYMHEANETLQKTAPRETGKCISYDVQKLRQDPEKMMRWVTQREDPPVTQADETSSQIWENKYNALHVTRKKMPERKNRQKQVTGMGKESTTMEHNSRMGTIPKTT